VAFDPVRWGSHVSGPPSRALFFVLAFLVLACNACTRYSVSGTVSDESGKPVKGCQVVLELASVAHQSLAAEVKSSTTTDAKGFFSFSFLAPRATGYVLRVRKQGYAEEALPVGAHSRAHYHFTIVATPPTTPG